jgi:peptidyl-prolyl cis-trans isomerase C
MNEVILARQAAPSYPLRLSARWRELLSEPFFHFLVLGAVLFGINQYLEVRSRFTHIAITPGIVQGIAENYRLQYGNLPTPQRLDALVEARIREEVFYHEALRLGLDRDDEIIRRRLAQKYEFLQQDLEIVAEPSDQALRTFFDANKLRYQLPGTVSFSHVYFSADTRGEEGARADAARIGSVLAARGVSRAPDEGDPFPGPTDFAGVSLAELGRVFGREGLASDIFALGANRWSGPIASGLGWHLVYVNSQEPARAPSFDEVREVARRDYLEAAQLRRNEKGYERLKRGFVIERE